MKFILWGDLISEDFALVVSTPELNVFMYPHSSRFMREVYTQYRCILMNINRTVLCVGSTAQKGTVTRHACRHAI
jgi:hypothetical protein